MTFQLNHPQIQADMAQIDAELRRVLSLTRYSQNIRKGLDYLIQTPGKRIRPLLTVLSYRSIYSEGVLPLPVIRLAASIELIHMASLVHDDIIDAADTRHGKPSFFKQFGSEVAIPVGVLLYSISLKLLTQVGHLSVISRVSRAVDQLCSGELDQVLNRNQFDMTIVDYLLILKKKTSALFSLAMWGGVLLAGDDHRQQDAFHFGTSLGLLFQISDDLLDFSGRADHLLKGGNQDFLLGEITLPLIILLDKLSTDNRSRAIHIMEQREWDGLVWMADQMIDLDIEGDCVALMKRYHNRCTDYINVLPRNEFTSILRDVVAYIAGRGTVSRPA